MVESKYLGMRYGGTILRLENAKLNKVSNITAPDFEVSHSGVDILPLERSKNLEGYKGK